MPRPLTINFTIFRFLIIVLSVLGIAYNANAQSTKPKLVTIKFDEQSNNDGALTIAKKLNPDLFYIDPNFDKDGSNTSHFAKHLALDINNKDRFLAATVSDTGYFCTKYGCPTYIYLNNGANKWQLALSVQSHQIYQDLNTKGSGPDNLITVSQEAGQRKVTAWLWNGQRYAEAKSR